MAMTKEFRANAMCSALIAETKELSKNNDIRACLAIQNYLFEASVVSLARLHATLIPEPRPLSELLEEERSAGRII